MLAKDGDPWGRRGCRQSTHHELGKGERERGRGQEKLWVKVLWPKASKQ